MTSRKLIGLRAERLEDAVILADFRLQLFRKQHRLHQIRHPQAGARGLVAVGRADAALGRADLRVAFPQLALFIERAVIGQNEVGAITDQQILPDLDLELAQPFDLGDERDRIDHDAVADHADFAAPQNSRRDQVENVFRAAMDDGVAGVIPALAADDDVRLGGEDIDDLSFAFIAPLRADQNCVRHEIKK